MIINLNQYRSNKRIDFKMCKKFIFKDSYTPDNVA